MDPKHTGEILRHLEKQHDHLMDAYRSMTHELHKLQVEEEMLMRKFYELMVAKGLNKKARVIEETVNEAVDSALDSEDIEEEIEEEVDKVLTALAGETVAQLPEAARKEKLKQPAKVAGDEVEDEAIAEGADDEEELEEIRARLARVMS